MEFADEAAAQLALAHAGRIGASARGLYLGATAMGRVLTISYTVEPTAFSIDIDGRTYALDVAGLEAHTIDDHRSGTHDPVGVLLDARGTGEARRMDAREVAPLLLERCGVPVPAHLRPLAIS